MRLDFIDEIKRTIKACRLFLFIPIFAMADGGLDTITANQGGSMTTNGCVHQCMSIDRPYTELSSVTELLNIEHRMISLATSIL